MAAQILRQVRAARPQPDSDTIAKLVLVHELLERVDSETLSDAARRGAALVLGDAIESLEGEGSR